MNYEFKMIKFPSPILLFGIFIILISISVVILYEAPIKSDNLIKKQYDNFELLFINHYLFKDKGGIPETILYHQSIVFDSDPPHYLGSGSFQSQNDTYYFSYRIDNNDLDFFSIEGYENNCPSGLSMQLLECSNYEPLDITNKTTISVTSDKSSYKTGELIKISGKIVNPKSELALNIFVKHPNGNIVSISQHTISSSGMYSTSITAGGYSMRDSGMYDIFVMYGTEKIIDSTSFRFSRSTIPIISSSNGVFPILGTDSYAVYSISGTNPLAVYSIRGVDIYSIIQDVETVSLEIFINALNDGSLKLAIPRDVLDASMNNQDYDFFVTVDGLITSYDETSSSDTRILTINFPSGTEDIEIFGTHIGSPNFWPYFTPSLTNSSEFIIETVFGSNMPGCAKNSDGCFTPFIAVVDVGQKIIFLNTDSSPHTFTSGNSKIGLDGDFDSNLIYPLSSFEYVPKDSGEIEYFCLLHPWMEGLIIINDDIK